jgi:hypothetical protein
MKKRCEMSGGKCSIHNNNYEWMNEWMSGVNEWINEWMKTER